MNMKQMHLKIISISVLSIIGSNVAVAEQKSADEIAKELANPAGSMASLNFNLEYKDYKGDLNKADNQNSTTLTFQPALPFPVGDKGRKIIFRPLFSMPIDQPVFDPANNNFEDADFALGDTTFDLVYAGTEMQTKKDGYLWGIGLAGTLPTATEEALQGDQWRFGPEVFGGIIREWGIVGALVSHQWDVGGSNDDSFSTTAAQYFYALSLGDGWQIASSPVLSYNWKADDNDEAWTIPVGVGLAKTTKINGKPWKFQLQVQKYVEQPDAFGPDWMIKFTATPVIKNPFLKFF
ncbi:MAG: hypothetical protein QNK19_07775 [Xanthomonadales bacterium]|nr:hypothetical protein [Xanthomonadales bacterium]